MNKIRIFVIAALVLSAVYVSGEDNSDSINTDDLFSDSGDLVTEESSSATDAKDFSNDLLTSDNGVRIGGKYYFEVTTDVTQSDLSSFSSSDVTDSYTVDLGSTVFFDARPDEDIRVLGKVEITYPFTYEEDDGESRNFDDVFHVTELFSDFNIDNKVFFRAGKSTINWGVGYYFSPADLLNLSQIDPENPDDELEGPVSVKMNIPYGLNNFYLYIVSPEGITSASELALAPKAEFVIGSSEIGIGAYYQKDHAPAAMATVTTGGGDASLFAEGVVSYGSDKVFVNPDFSTETYDDTLFFKGTVGGIYTWSDDLADFDLTFTGQYLYNGEGYDEDDQDFLTANRLQIISTNVVSVSDIKESGKHYGAGSFYWKDMLGSDFSFNLFWLGNLSDGSGLLKPALSYDRFEDIGLSLSFPYYYGEAGDEYTVTGDSFGISFVVSLGGTAF